MMNQEGSLLPPKEFLPRHIGIIMDGNGRWAKQRGLARSAGHRRGAEVFEQIIHDCTDIGIPMVTAYAFSTENWKRPADEVQGIMNLLRSYLKRVSRFQKENIRLRFLGDRTALDDDLQRTMADAEAKSAANTGTRVNLAINYGGRDDLVHAVRALAELAAQGKLEPGQIDEQMVSDHLYTAGMPDPDLIIRPSGEERLSNFLTWQSAYSELVFMDVLWPDFNREHLCRALMEYARRDRRFGGV